MNKQWKNRSIARSFLLWPVIACALVPQLAQAQSYLPQIADGGNWYTAIMLNNQSTSAGTVSINFYQDTANGATAPWNPPFLEVGSTQSLTVPAGGTMYIHTSGTAAALTQGWGQVTGSSGISVFAIYTYESFVGRPNQDGTSPAVASASRILVPFDATTGYSTGVAIVNPTGASEAVSVNIETDDGTVTQPSFPSLPANGQLAVNMATQFPSVAGHRGQAEFYVSSGSLSIAAFRINPTVALTSIPVTLASGSPVLGAGGGSPGGGGTGSLPQFSLISVIISSLSGATSVDAVGSFLGLSGNGYSGAYIDITESSGSAIDYRRAICQFSNVNVSGYTFTASGPETGSSCYMFGNGTANSGVTSGSMTITFSPQGAPSVGSFTGSINLVSGLGTISGTLSGSYTAE